MQNTKNDVTINIGAVFTNLKKQLASAKNEVKKAFATGTNISMAMNNFEKINKNVDGFTKAISPVRRQFQGWAMSIMFFGMALQKIFTDIWKNGTKTFNDIMHSVEGTVTGFDMLDGSIKYLQFSIGQALEPLAFMMIPIIDAVSEWISENEGLTRTIVSTGLVLGGIFAVGGAGALAINGFLELGEKIGFILTKTDGLKNFDWTALGNAITKGIGLISIGFSLFMAKDAINDFKNGKVMEGLLEALGATATFSGGVMLLKGKGGAYGGALVVAGFALDYASKNQSTFLQDLFNLISYIIPLFGNSAIYIGELFNKMFTDLYYSARIAWLKIVGLFTGKTDWSQISALKLAIETPGKTWLEIYKTQKDNIQNLGKDIQNMYNDMVTGKLDIKVSDNKDTNREQLPLLHYQGYTPYSPIHIQTLNITDPTGVITNAILKEAINR